MQLCEGLYDTFVDFWVTFGDFCDFVKTCVAMWILEGYCCGLVSLFGNLKDFCDSVKIFRAHL